MTGKGLIIIMGVAVLSLVTSATFAGVAGASDRVNAKLSRNKAKITSLSRRDRLQLESQAKQRSGADDGCGRVDIGSVYPDRSGAVPREVTVIVTGDVINSPKCK